MKTLILIVLILTLNVKMNQNIEGGKRDETQIENKIILITN